MLEIENEETGAKRICHFCVNERYLASEIRALGKMADCDYCVKRASSISIDELAERIEEAFSDHYERTADQPDSWEMSLQADRESSYTWNRQGIPIHDAIQDAAGIDEEPTTDVLEVLEEKYAPVPSDYCGEESEFSSDSCYQLRSNSTYLGFHTEWQEFEQSLKTKARFFSRTAEELLSKVFGDIGSLKTRAGQPIVVAAGPETDLTHLYRARVFQAEDGLLDALCHPDAKIGSPPSKLARAGRMNAQGISVFYGATKVDVAIAEVRPPVGSRVVAAKFDIIRRIFLLDLTAMDDVHQEGSIFDPTFKERLRRADFLRTLKWRMGRAVMPDDEGIDYLPTQAVADFLATANDPRLDGIIFPSVQVKAGYNVVLFHESARVGAAAIPVGAEVEANMGQDTGDYEDIYYSVAEIVPPPIAPKINDEEDEAIGPELFCSPPPSPYDDYRQETLRLDASSVEVHHVTWVEVSTEAHPVHRYRREKPSAS